MTVRINQIVPLHEALNVSFGDTERTFSWMWLRDHSQDAESFHPKTKQRLLETFDLDAPEAPEVELEEDGSALALHWKGAAKPSRYTAEYLATVDSPAELYNVTVADQVLWDGSAADEALNRFGYREVGGEDGKAFGDMLLAIKRYGMAMVTEMPLRKEAVGDVMERIGYIRRTIFGTLWEFSSDGEIDDTAATPLDIKPHTDGTYSHDAPGLQALLCLSYEATGGNNTLVDGLFVAGRIRQEHPDAYRILCETSVPGQYIGDGSYLVAQRPPLRADAAGRIVQVSYNNHDRAPFLLPEPLMGRLYAALALFDGMVNDPANQIEFGLCPGEMIIFDNWRLLHGRKAFQGSRRMAGCYMNREDFESRLRMLAPGPLDMTAPAG